MSLTYSTYVNALSSLMVVPSSDENFQIILPDIIDYAEQRIYRELDLVTTVTVSTASMTANSRNMTIPGSLIVLQSMNAVTPASTSPDNGTRVPLQRISLEAMNYLWPTMSSTGIPAYYALVTDTTIRLAPTPDAAYMGEFNGTIRPAPLSASNTTTFLTTNLPDLFLAASMVFGSGWQRDFGAQTEDPQVSQSWENQYQQLRQSAIIEEARRKAMSTAWQPFQPAPLATPPRQ